MSRSGYSDDCDNLAMWRGQVASAIRGKRGQMFLRDLVVALDALPEKKLIAGDLITPAGEVCAIGSVGLKRGVEMAGLDSTDHESLSRCFNVARQLVQEVEWMNDEACDYVTPEERWKRMRAWAVENLLPAPGAVPTKEESK